MSTRNKLIGIAIIIAVSYAFGRYTAPEKIKIVTKISDTVQQSTDKDKDLDTHKETKTTEVKHPDGTTETTTDVTEDTHVNTDNKTASSDTKVSETDKEVTKSTSHLTLSALAGVQLTGVTTASPVVYGAHVTKDILGPINIGVWGLDNRTMGASIGLTF